MKTLFLHIGTHKTGTTALQQILSFNREALEVDGWLYPRAGCPESNFGHHDAAWGLIKAKKKPFDFAGLQGEILNSRCEQVVMSSEEFEFCRNVEIVRAEFDYCDVFIVLYLRRQDDLLLSEYNQHLKSGIYFKPLAQFAEMLDRQGRLDYMALCQHWATAFGKERILVRPYHPNTSIIEEFCKLVGITTTLKEPTHRFSNRSLDSRLTGTLRVINQLRSNQQDDYTYKELVGVVSRYGAQLKDKQKFSLMAPSERKQFMRKYEESNRQLFDSFLEGHEFTDPLIENSDEIRVSENHFPPDLVRVMLNHLAKRPQLSPESRGEDED
ncbi:hypothetical protein DO97_04290 [Neosynechococcus sphagnicola sy1]|uniref:Sulfotransferase domain-containing protein n=1 Tax=Neosynechococcus sphagnicola sy1 TaxID=1497020 RepID=A0A098TKV6_9CYAN|nr:hypothetical protein [Neosynechococcus sphagnicola]KGF72921.1 hypothetical protein DO97_04290 [Neosynechococcus sphagnicola sy1]